jgi:hypothetical protein
MAPQEVAGLQALAMKHGGSLTINPETGLPEAGFLSSILPALAGFALNAFVPGLGAAVGGAFGLGAAAGTGIAVGGITSLATGSLSRGLMAGMGAYGGAGLSEGLMNAGASAGAGQTLATEAAKTAAEEGIALPSNYAEMAAKTATPDQIAAARTAATSNADLISAGAKSAAADPTGFLKSSWKPLAAAAAPIMADAMVPTTTKAPPLDTGNIRKFSYDPYGQTYTPLGVYPAAGYKGMAGGGIVALAEGGTVNMAAGTPPEMLTDEQLYQKTGSWEAAAAARDAQNNALNQYNWQQQAAQQAAPVAQAAAAPAAQAIQTAAPAPVTPNADAWWAKQAGGLEAMYSTINNQIAANPNMTDAQIDAAMKQYGISSEDVHNALQKGGGSMAEEYAVGAGNMGLSGLNQNINSWIAKASADPNFKMLSAEQKQQAARDAMGTVNMNEADVLRATGKTIAQLFPKTTTVTPTGVYGTYGNNTGVAATTTPGDIGANPDGTVTVFPNIPGRPEGGFTGMGQVKDVYTQGGGSLGQTNLFVPKTVEEMYARYGNTGGSKQAYDFLMGKGAVDIKKPVTATGEIMKPYTESVMGMPTNLATKKYIFQDGKYVLNPAYKPLAYDSKGNRIVSASAGEISKAAEGGGSGFQAMVDAGSVTYEQIASALGITVDEAKKKFPKATPIAEAGTSANTSVESSSGTGGLAAGGMATYAVGGGLGSLGSYSDGGRLLKGPGDGVSDSIPATIGQKQQPARLADGEFVVPARIVSELGNGSTDAGAKKLYAMMDRVQRARGKTTGKNKVAANTRSEKYLPA